MLYRHESTECKQSVWHWYVLNIGYYAHFLVFNTPNQLAARRLAIDRGMFSLSKRVLCTGLPNTMPYCAYITAHHRRTATPLEYHAMFAFLGQYDVVRVAIALNTQRLAPLGLRWLPRFVFGAIDFKSLEGPDAKYYSIYEPMRDCILKGQRCAVIVFPDIAGSTYWGDTTMTARKGVYAASLALGVPIVDIVHFEPSVTDEATVDVSVYEAPTKQSVFLDNDAYKTWRRDNDAGISSFRHKLSQEFMRKVAHHESNYGVCPSGDANGVSVHNQVVIDNLARNRKARAVLEN